MIERVKESLSQTSKWKIIILIIIMVLVAFNAVRSSPTRDDQARTEQMINLLYKMLDAGAMIPIIGASSLPIGNHSDGGTAHQGAVP